MSNEKIINLHNNTAEIYVPDNLPLETALARTTHMAIGAHQDDGKYFTPSQLQEIEKVASSFKFL